MLKTVWLTEQSNKKETALLLGGFDGLHAGHRQLLSYAKASGLAVGVTCIVGAKGGEDLFTLAEREQIFREAGADFVEECFFEEIKNMPPLDFLRVLEKKYAPSLFVCGDDFRFGANAAGTPDFLKRSTRVRVETFPLLEMEGAKVSARRIKTLVGEGRVDEVDKFLTHPFFLVGEVRKDRGVGRNLGFPTANILYPKEKYPLKRGVYETRAQVGGKWYKGITNYGTRPTFSDDALWTETYLDGFDGDLYGKTLRVEFVRFLRDVKKFDSAEALQEQLRKDVGRVRTND